MPFRAKRKNHIITLPNFHIVTFSHFHKASPTDKSQLIGHYFGFTILDLKSIQQIIINPIYNLSRRIDCYETRAAARRPYITKNLQRSSLLLQIGRLQDAPTNPYTLCFSPNRFKHFFIYINHHLHTYAFKRNYNFIF